MATELLLLLFSTRTEESQAVIEGSEKWRSTPDDLEEREMRQSRRKPLPPLFETSDTSQPFAHEGRHHTTPAANGHLGTWFLIHRKVNSPVPSLQWFRTVKILILTTTIHDQEVTMAQPRRASFTIQTWPWFRFEKRRSSKTH